MRHRPSGSDGVGRDLVGANLPRRCPVGARVAVDAERLGASPREGGGVDLTFYPIGVGRLFSLRVGLPEHETVV